MVTVTRAERTQVLPPFQQTTKGPPAVASLANHTWVAEPANQWIKGVVERAYMTMARGSP